MFWPDKGRPTEQERQSVVLRIHRIAPVQKPNIRGRRSSSNDAYINPLFEPRCCIGRRGLLCRDTVPGVWRKTLPVAPNRIALDAICVH